MIHLLSSSFPRFQNTDSRWWHSFAKCGFITASTSVIYWIVESLITPSKNSGSAFPYAVSLYKREDFFSFAPLGSTVELVDTVSAPYCRSSLLVGLASAVFSRNRAPFVIASVNCLPGSIAEEVFSASYDLSSLDASNSVTITNTSSRSFQILNARNFLGDRLSNILCLGQEGAVLIFNQPNGLASEINAGVLSSLNGLTFSLKRSFLKALIPLAGGGDFNGDGFGDILLRNEEASQLYIFFGKSRGSYPAQVDSHLAFILSSIFLNAASFSGDINADGSDDLLFSFFVPIKTPTCNGTNAFYILYGNPKRTNQTIAFQPAGFSSLNGSLVITTEEGCAHNPGLFVGANVLDVNGDGLQDVAFGAPYSLQKDGRVFIVFGSKNLPVQIDLDNLSISQGFKIDGVQQSAAMFGKEVLSAGDLNADGLQDIVVIGTPLASPLPSGYEGAIYVVFGSRDPKNLQLSELDGQKGFAIRLVQTASLSLEPTAAFANDINQDGINDLVISHEGVGYALFGRKTGFPAVVDLANLNGVDGFLIRNVGVNTLIEAINAGDLNGDQVSDIWISQPGSMRETASKITIIFPDKIFIPNSLSSSSSKVWMWVVIAFSGAIFLSATCCLAYRLFLWRKRKKYPLYRGPLNIASLLSGSTAV